MAVPLLKNIYLSTLAFLRPLNLEERYKIAAQEIVRIAGADHASIFLGDKTGELTRVYSNVPEATQTEPRSKGFAHKSYVNGKLYVVSPKILRETHLSLYKKGVKSLVLVPLSFNNITIGVIALQYHTSVEFNEKAIDTLNLFGSLISLGIRNSQLYEQTKDAVESRDLFISLASHELKTPLTTISAYTQQISKKINNRQIPTEKSVEILKAEVRRLKHMLNELLEIDQIKTGQLSYNWKIINITHIVKRALINFKFSYPGYKVLIDSSLQRVDRILQGDDEKLIQVITNLLNNSAKFSSKDTPIVLTLGATKNDIAISITDYGKGIRKSEQNKVFTEFFKAKDNLKEGMGLGLYLVKGIVERHQGTVTLQSRLNKGTTVTLKLPKKLYE